MLEDGATRSSSACRDHSKVQKSNRAHLPSCTVECTDVVIIEIGKKKKTVQCRDTLVVHMEFDQCVSGSQTKNKTVTLWVSNERPLGPKF